jgi:hypothetical protein
MDLSGQAAELKQQGVLEAARDPNSKVTAQDAEHTIIKEARKAGAPAFEFDPNASAAEKAAQVDSVIHDSNITPLCPMQLEADVGGYSTSHLDSRLLEIMWQPL